MQSDVETVDQYIEELETDRKDGIIALRETILKHIPEGFHEEMSYGMVGYVVPHSLYPPGYHCDPALPLPFAGFASQKKHYSFYHMGIYADTKLLNWFQEEYGKRIPTKLNMSKSCIRISKMTPEILELLGELIEKITVEDWITLYEKSFKSGSNK